MKISVIIPFFDSKKRIESTYDYLRRQVGCSCELEIIIVNSCNDENSSERLGKIESDAPEEILLVNISDEAQKCDYLNVGMDYATGDYLLFVIAGDILNINLFHTLEIIADRSRADIVTYSPTRAHYKFDMFDDDPFSDNSFIISNIESIDARKEILANDEISDSLFCHAYRRDFLKKTEKHFVDDISLEEMAFSFPLFFNASIVAYTKQHGYCMMFDEKNDDYSRRIAERMREQIRLLEELKSNSELYSKYKDEIEYHFIKEYYIKNLKLIINSNASTGTNIKIYEIMQYVCLKMVPKWIENDYIFGLAHSDMELMKLLYRKIEDDSFFDEELKKERLVTVITTTYNRSNYLKTSMECILWQTYGNIEYIIVDDGSSDDIESIVKSFNDERIVYVRNTENRGVSYSRNQGIKRASGKFIVYQDDDDQCRLDKVEKEVDRLLETSSDCAFVYCESINHTRRIQGITDKPALIIPDKAISVLKKNGYIFPALLPKNFITSTAAMFKKEIVVELGGYDEELFAYEDWDLFLNISRKYKVEFIEEPLYDYYQRANSLISSKDEEHRKKIIQSLYFIDKKYEPYRNEYGIETSFKIVG
jgi:glycosyltransferase involved in cell wall biosynthesis